MKLCNYKVHQAYDKIQILSIIEIQYFKPFVVAFVAISTTSW